MGRFLALSALALALVPSTYASLAVDYAPVKGVSQNGYCGNGVTCVGSGFGNCCSAEGSCGSSEEHCGDSCQSLFGICPQAVLNKRYAEEGAALDAAAAAVLDARGLEVRATSKVCRTAMPQAPTGTYTCVPPKTSVVKSANPTNYRAFCSSWNANKPHQLSPWTKEGLLKPTAVSNACSCILADPQATTTFGYTCVPDKTSVVKSANPTNYRAFCSSWNANKPHQLSPWTKEGLLKPTAVSNACTCILRDPAATTNFPTKAAACTLKKRRRRSVQNTTAPPAPLET